MITKNENIMRKTNKKAILLLLISAFTLEINAMTAYPILTIINIKANSPSLNEQSAFMSFPLSYPWMLIYHTLFILVLTLLIIKTYVSWRKNKKLNTKMVHLIRTVYNLQKKLELIKGPLDDIVKDDNINEAQKSKIQLAIWSTSKVQSTVSNLIEQEKSDNFFQSIIESAAGKRIHLKERIESKILSYTQQKKVSTQLHPDSLPSKDSLSDMLFMEKLITILKENLDSSDFTIDTLSQKIGMSRSSLYHRIKNISGLAPADFIRLYRLEIAKDLLATHQYTVSEVAYKTGFSDVKYFRAVFKKQYKTNPGNFSRSSQ